jgi:cellulose synthase/poly-beta-1,6-N-acetylglucosamine synthase-like glycosyltransferase
MENRWLNKKIENKNWKDIYHIIILPTYKESKEIIEESIETLERANYPKEKIIIVLAAEERAGEVFKKQALAIANKYSDKFYKFIVTIHPEFVEGRVK